MAEPPAPDVPAAVAGVFDDFLGTTKTTRGADLRVDLQLTFDEAVEGCVREVAVMRATPCAPCKGTGFAPERPVSACPECAGTGRISREQGQLLIQQTCPRCTGRAKVGTACATCAGQGVQRKTESTTVTVPAGVEDGFSIRLAEKGDRFEGGPPGHLYVVLEVTPHARFTRRGNDLVVDVRIAPELAAAGGSLTVPLLHGEREVTVPAGARPGDELVVRGAGVPVLGAPVTPVPGPSEAASPYRELDTSGRGNLIVRLRIHKGGPGAWLRWLFRLDER